MSKSSPSTKPFAPLTDMQIYIGSESIDEFRAGRMSRRALFRRLVAVCGGAAGAAALLAACSDDEGAAMMSSLGDAGVDGGSDAGADGGRDAGAAGDAARGDGGLAKLSVAADDPAVTASAVKYTSAGGDVSAYLARPKAAGNAPGVIVIHENRGLNDHIRDVARRVAKAGFVALAPDLTSRGGTTDKLDPNPASAFLGGAKPEDLIADLNAGVDFLAKQSGVSPTDKLGVVGFCFGGGLTFRLAGANPKIAAAVPYYGPVTPDILETLKNTNAAILAHYGANDSDRVNGPIPATEMALKDAGKTFEKRLHEGAGHAFNNDTGASYNEREAVAAWADTIAWFGKYLRA